MRKRSVGLLLVLTLIIAAGTVAQDFRFDTSIATERAHALNVERQTGALMTSLAGVRAAQASYVAAGQGPDFWMSKVTDLAGGISVGIAKLRAVSSVSAAIERYNEAEAALAEFNMVDSRVRDLVRNDQRLPASDLVFLDAMQPIEKVEVALNAARTAELADSEQRIATLGKLRLAMNAATLAGLLALAIVMRPVAPTAEAKPAPTTVQMLRDLPPPVKNTVSMPAPPPPPVVVQPAVKPANLSAAAELCVDLARVIDARDVPALVQRTASVLEAKGVVLWVADPTGALLHPSVTHGYADKVLARLQPLPVNGENVTSLAYRTMQPQTVSGSSPADAGAVAVPLITSSGCVGVLAAETRPNRTGQDVLPLARIIAAQFASIVAPVDAAVATKTAQA